ncbi:MAG: cytidine deaminase [Clostridia bacterium]|nr:cytidine deaminase [Clostridia bacterium]
MSETRELIRAALEAREMAYTPYSHFKVGAALLAKDGTVWRGCNIENAAYTPTNCAERTAFFKAVSEGCREFSAIAVVGGREGPVTEECAPCGVCRQVMAEFCDPDDFRVILAADEEHYSVYRLRELLPQAFVPSRL